jgi:hypothetical protein
MNKTTLAILAALSASIALADDFKTTDGREYKNAKASRVEPDGIVITFSGGIVKLPFIELPGDVQKKYGYNSTAAAAYSAEENQKQSALAQQRKADEQQRIEERQKYWSEHPTPQPQQQSSAVSALHGSSLDRPAHDQATTAVFLVSQYATNQLNAEKLYTGQTFSISGTIKSINWEGGAVEVELFVPYYYVGKAWYMHCIFNDSTGLEKYQAGGTIGFVGTVAGLRGRTLTIKDCQLSR